MFYRCIWPVDDIKQRSDRGDQRIDRWVVCGQMPGYRVVNVLALTICSLADEVRLFKVGHADGGARVQRGYCRTNEGRNDEQYYDHPRRQPIGRSEEHTSELQS